MSADDVLDAALRLTPDERVALAERLLESVRQGPSAEWSRAWAAELDERWQRYRREGKAVTLEELERTLLGT